MASHSKNTNQLSNHKQQRYAPADDSTSSHRFARPIPKRSISSIHDSNYLDHYTIDTTSFSGSRMDKENSRDLYVRQNEPSTPGIAVSSQLIHNQQRRYPSSQSQNNPLQSPFVNRQVKKYSVASASQPPSRVRGVSESNNYNNNNQSINSIGNTVTTTQQSRHRNSSSHLAVSSTDSSKKLVYCFQNLHQSLLELHQRKYSPFSDVLCINQQTVKQGSLQNSYKTFLSSRLDCIIVAKHFDRTSAEKSKRAYEDEKTKHKLLEGKIDSLVDLLAYDNVGLRLFYDLGTVNLLSIHQKYIEVNIAFSENDLLSLTRQLIRTVSHFAVNSWFFNAFDDLSNFIFAKSTEGYQEYSLKVSCLEFASADPSQYHFDIDQLVFPKISSVSSKIVETQPTSNRLTKNRSISQVEHSSTKKSQRLPQQSISIWDKIFGYEIQQICSMIYTIYMQQNPNSNIQDTPSNGNSSNSRANNPFGKYSRLSFYLTSLFEEAQNPQNLGGIISKLIADASIPQSIIIEDTLIQQIRLTTTTQPMNELSQNWMNVMSPTKRTGNQKLKVPQADEMRSISMISVQTANKRYQEELIALREEACEEEGNMHKSQDYYENILSISHLKKQNPSTFPIISELIDEVLQRIDEETQPFSYAQILLSKAYISFKLKSEGTNPMSLSKHCILIVNRIQNNEINEICGCAYLIMSEMAARSSSHRSRALEYALKSYEIRKSVHGAQSSTIEIAECLIQVARMYVLKGSFAESLKYFEKASKIADELSSMPNGAGSVSRTSVEILTDHALALFNAEEFEQCSKKCEEIVSIYKKCGDHLMSYSFPLAMNLLTLTKVMQSIPIGQSQKSQHILDNADIKDSIALSIEAVKIAAELRGPEQSNTQAQNSLLQLQNSQSTTDTSEKATLQTIKSTIRVNEMGSLLQYFNILQQLQGQFSKELEECSAGKTNLPVLKPRQINGGGLGGQRAIPQGQQQLSAYKNSQQLPLKQGLSNNRVIRSRNSIDYLQSQQVSMESEQSFYA